MAQILYGVGNAILREFADPTKIVALSKLKNLSVEATASDEKIYGGDSPYPIASFPKEKSIKVSAENAVFDMKLLNATQGATVKTGSIAFGEIFEVIVPEDGVVTLPYTPVAGSVVCEGATFTQDGTDPKKLTFDGSEGKEVTIIYERTSSTTTDTIAVMKDTLAKPFKFIHRIAVYDDNNVVIGQAQLIVYKAKANNAFSFGLQPQTAFAPKIELEALDPKRPDGKLWDFSIEIGTPSV